MWPENREEIWRERGCANRGEEQENEWTGTLAEQHEGLTSGSWSQIHSTSADLCFSPAVLGCPAATERTCNTQNLAFPFARDAAIREAPHERSQGAEGVEGGVITNMHQRSRNRDREQKNGKA